MITEHHRASQSATEHREWFQLNYIGVIIWSQFIEVPSHRWTVQNQMTPQSMASKTISRGLIPRLTDSVKHLPDGARTWWSPPSLLGS
jgi:hypothetical protein